MPQTRKPNSQIFITSFVFCPFSVISEMQTFYSPDYHSSNHLTPVVNSSALIPSSGSSPTNTVSNTSGCLTKFNDIDVSNSSYPTYNNWSNGYNNYQYPTPTAAAASIPPSSQTQYPATPQVPHAAPAMLIYPQVYSTVNQNQIHLHLHGTDKIEQYLNSNENGLSLNSARNSNTEIALSGSTENQNVIMENDETDGHHHRTEHETTNREEESCDPSSVWRPY